MSSITFTVPGRIGGKQRAGRLVLPGGKVRSFNPAQTRSQEAIVRQIAALAMRGKRPMLGPMRVIMNIWRQPPASWSKKRVAETVWITGKPDTDNTQKLFYDAMNGIVWKDDAQIASVVWNRRYAYDQEFIAVEVIPL